MSLIYCIQHPGDKKWHPVSSEEYYAHQGPRDLIDTNAKVAERCVFVEVRWGKKMVFFGTPKNAIEGLKDIEARGNIDLRASNIVSIKMCGMNLPKAREQNIILNEKDLMAPGLLFLSFVIKNYTPTKEEREAEEKQKELTDKLKLLAKASSPKAIESMKINDIVSPINDPHCIRWVQYIDASKGLIKVVERRKDRSTVSAWLDQKLWQEAVIV